MDAEKIVQDLKRRFAAPLPEFYKRRIIFWYDEEREFEDQLPEIALDGVQVVALTGNNTFAVKKLLCEDDTASDFLVYDPRSFIKDDDNWLVNVQLYSEEFRADLNSIWMDEMGLPATPIIRNQIKNYRKFFRAKERRETVKKLNKQISTAPQMHLAVMAALCGNSDIQPNHIIKAVIKAGLDLNTNKIYQNFVSYGADKPFWVMVSQATGYNEGDDMSLNRLAVHMLLTASTRTLHTDHLAGLDTFFLFRTSPTVMTLFLNGCTGMTIRTYMKLLAMWKEKPVLRNASLIFQLRIWLIRKFFPVLTNAFWPL